MADEGSLERRLHGLEAIVGQLRGLVEETYAFVMGRTADALRERCERTRDALALPIRRADLHSHTTYSDGQHSVTEMERWRQRAGLDLLAITDHNTLAHSADCQAFPRILVGEEVTGQHHHVLLHQPTALIEPAHQLRLEVEHIRAAGRIPLVAHPTGWMNHIYDAERIQAVRALGGLFMMEIANGAANWYDYRDSTDETAVGLWDELLLSGRPVIAVGDSDAHRAPNVGLAWNGVVAESNTPEAIYAAITAGQGFISNGPIALLWAEGQPTTVTPLAPRPTVRLRVQVADSAGLARWRIVADGCTWKEDDAAGSRLITLECDAPGDRFHSYRLECVARDFRQAYTNPVRFALEGASDEAGL